MTTSKNLFNWVNADGTKTHSCPNFWPFGSIGPVSEYSFRYAPDSAVYEKQPKTKKVAHMEAVEAEETPPGVFAFAALAQTLSTLGVKS